MKKLAIALLCVCAAGGVMAAAAPTMNETGSWYANIMAGASFPVAMTTRDASGGWLKSKYNPGFSGGIAGGYEFANAISLEGQLGYIYNGVDKFQPSSTGTWSSSGHGSTSATDYMVNAFYHFYNASHFVPYFGLGLGGITVYHNWKPKNASGTTISLKGNDTVFAYQGIAGVAYQFNAQWSLGLDYRYLASSQGKYKLKVAGVKGTVKEYYRTNLVNLGLTYHFS
jgi:OmpA-OmpF porin, OOP family